MAILYRLHLVGLPNGGLGEALDLHRAVDDVLLASRRSDSDSDEPVTAAPGSFDVEETDLGCASEGESGVMTTRGGFLIAEGDDTWTVAARTIRMLSSSPSYVFHADKVYTMSSNGNGETFMASSYDLTYAGD